MSDLRFGGSPKNGWQAQVTYDHAEPTPFHVEIRVGGHLTDTLKYSTKSEAELAAYNINSGKAPFARGL